MEGVRHQQPDRPRLEPLHIRNISTVSADSDSSLSTPTGDDVDDTNFFTTQVNDSQSSLGMAVRETSSPMDQEREHRLTPISKLPPELLIAIFTKLASTSDLRNSMLVCYNWALNTVGILWHRPLCNNLNNLTNVAGALNYKYSSFFPYHDLVRRLNLAALSGKVSDATVEPFASCKRIERLTLTNCSGLTDSGVSGMVEGNKHLQALDVTDLEALTDKTIFALADNCPRLQGLNITNCTLITDDSLIAVSKNCRQLKRLKLNSVFRVTDVSVTAFAQNCRSILEIDLAQCRGITSPSVTALLSNLSHLRELRLAHCEEITDSAFLDLSPRLHFDSLRILDLTACEQVRDDAIARIIPAAPRLRNLVLAKCRNITDRAVNSICKLTKNLHYIHLGHCTNITDAAVINLVKACNRIRYIDLACCGRLTDASVTQLAQLPKLRRIGLVKCQQLTDRSIIALARGPLIFSPSGRVTGASPHYCSLERVHLSYCINLSLKGITALLTSCPRLTHLSLTGVGAFLRPDLTRFCRDAPQEFTHPQRDVFCVFSGEGVQRLREYLSLLAREEAREQGRDAMDESLLDGEESPGVDTMSDDGTLDGNDPRLPFTAADFPPLLPIINAPRPRQRPRSLHDLNLGTYVEMPLFPPDQMQRMGPLTPNADTPERRDSLGPAHLNLMSSSGLYQNDPQHENRDWVADQVLGQADMERTPSRNASRRHTLEWDLSGPLQSQDYPFGGESSRRGTLGPYGESARQSQGLSNLLPPPVDPRLQGNTFGHRNLDPRHVWLNPDPSFSAFDANHEAIMATIPRSRAASRNPSRSNSPHVSRVGSVGALNLLAPGPPPPQQGLGPITLAAHRSASGSSSRSRTDPPRFEEGQHVTLRSLMQQDARRHFMTEDESPGRRPINDLLYSLPADQIMRLPVPSMGQSTESIMTTRPTPSARLGANNMEGDDDVQMTQ